MTRSRSLLIVAALALVGPVLLPADIVHALGPSYPLKLAYVRSEGGSEATFSYLYKVTPSAIAPGQLDLRAVFGSGSDLSALDSLMTTGGKLAASGLAVGFWWPAAGSEISYEGFTGTLVGSGGGLRTYRFSPGAMGSTEDWLLDADGYLLSVRASTPGAPDVRVDRVGWSAALETQLLATQPFVPGEMLHPSDAGFAPSSVAHVWEPCYWGEYPAHYAFSTAGGYAVPYGSYGD